MLGRSGISHLGGPRLCRLSNTALIAPRRISFIAVVTFRYILLGAILRLVGKWATSAFLGLTATRWNVSVGLAFKALKYPGLRTVVLRYVEGDVDDQAFPDPLVRYLRVGNCEHQY